MGETKLPTYLDLMLPTLRAVDELGGDAHINDIDPKAIAEAGITDEQMSVEFPPDSSQSGPKVLHRLAWARTILRRVDALESHGSGVWALTETGRTLLDLDPEEADRWLREAVESDANEKRPSDEALQTLRERAESGSPEQMTVRELIGLWGAGRRWSTVNERIVAALNIHGLTTDPDFTSVGLDQTIKLVGADGGSGQAPPITEPATLRVGNLPSATGGIESVTANDSLLTAQTKMWTNDYSQLAVLNGTRNLKGAISWESIARARLRKPKAELKDCVVDAVEVKVDTPLLEAIRIVASSEFVFVRESDNTVSGIVTTMDLSDQFSALAGPFLVLGEIERLLRIPLDRNFTIDELTEAVDPDDGRTILGSHSLSLGEIQRVLEQPENWDRLGWPADRKVFVNALDDIRKTRNEIMHFNPDPLEPGRIYSLEAFLRMVRELVLES